MSIHSFTLTLEGVGTDDASVRLHAIGCEDALVGEEDGRTYAAFTRRGPTLEDAVMSAQSDMEAAGIRVLDVDASEDA